MSERDLFIAALKITEPVERSAWLDRECGDDVALRERVEVLLRAFDKAGSLLETLAVAGGLNTDEPVTEGPGAIIGPYKLLQQIGEGGMGVVWMAEQTQPVQRKVALKVIKPGMDSRQVIARFEAERQALAMMDHVNIARVLDGGATENGRPYFVMELVHGVPITKYCDDNHMTPRERLELFVPVCQAIQHAHQKGIIHRDVKPSNVMVTLYDGKPVPKVIDFGVAKATEQKLTERTLFTQYGALVGTLEYMSPEQADMSALGVDTRSDIYSLGVLLYELLTGNTPLTHIRMKEVAYAEILRMIKEVEPPKPSTRLSDSGEALASISANRHTEPAKLTKLVKGELDWIVMKTLEKDRNRRYETAKDFAADVQRYLADEPVLACPPSAWYRFRKFARRSKAAIGVAGMVLFFLVLLGSGAGWALRDREAREQEIAQETARKLALTEEGIRQALDRGTKSRAELHAILKKPGGVQLLLNRPTRWELLIKTAQGELAQARGVAVRAEGSLDAEWTQAMDQFEQQLTRDQADYDLAMRLEKIRLEVTSSVDGYYRFHPDHARRQYPLAFADAGLAVEPGRENEVAERIARSPIRELLLAGLDDWAWAAEVEVKQPELPARLLAVARLVDPDPWRNQFRDPATRKSPLAIQKLADAAQADPALMVRLTPHMLTAVGRKLQRQPAKAVAWLRRAQVLHPADFWINQELGYGYMHVAPEGGQGNVKLGKSGGAEAVGFFRAAVALRPDNSMVYNDLGIALRHNKDLPAAIDAFKKAVELNPQYAGAWNNLGVARADSKDLPGAIACYRKAIEINPQYAAAWSNLGNVLGDSKDLPGAIKALERAVAIDPQYAAAWSNLGVARRDNKDLPGAIDAFKKALAIDKQDADAWNNLGNAFVDSKELREGIDAFKNAVAINPQYARAWYNLGTTLHADKDLRGAIFAFKKALAIDKQDADAWNNLGNAQLASKDLPGAIDAYKNALAIDKNFAGAWMNLGNARLASKDLPGAIDAYEKALAIDKNLADAWINLGLARRQTKNMPGAIDAYKNALAINPHDAEAWNILANALRSHGLNLLQQEKWTDAEPVLRECLHLLEQKSPNTYMRFDAAAMVGGALLGQKKYADAEPLLLEGHDGMKQREKTMPAKGKARVAEVALRLVQLYDATGKKYDAAKWRAILEQHEGAKVGSVHDVGDGLKLHGKLDGKITTLVYEVKLTAGKTYVIDMVSTDQKTLDPYLVLQDADRQPLAEDDDGGDGLNARLTYRAPRDGVYRILATSFNTGRGEFTLTVREKQ